MWFHFIYDKCPPQNFMVLKKFLRRTFFMVLLRQNCAINMRDRKSFERTWERTKIDKFPVHKRGTWSFSFYMLLKDFLGLWLGWRKIFFVWEKVMNFVIFFLYFLKLFCEVLWYFLMAKLEFIFVKISWHTRQIF